MKPNKKIRFVSIAVGITLTGILVAVLINDPETPDTSSQPESQVEATRTEVTPFRLSVMHWNDLGKLLADITMNEKEIQRVIGLVDDSNTPVTLYLKGLLLLTQNKPQQALDTFDRITIDQIPANFLYAPHRLHQQLKSNETDPYLLLLEKAVRENKTSALVKARVLAANGNLEEALSSYLKSDPAQWASYDLRLFRQIGNNQGLATDLSKVITGAISSGRPRKNLLPDLQQIAKNPASNTDIADFEQRIKNEIKNNTPIGKIALESAKVLLRDRKLFMNKQYQRLIELYGTAKPIKLTNETLLLLFLSSVRINNRQQAEIWGQELKRRHSTDNVETWVNKMLAPLS